MEERHCCNMQRATMLGKEEARTVGLRASPKGQKGFSCTKRSGEARGTACGRRGNRVAGQAETAENHLL